MVGQRLEKGDQVRLLLDHPNLVQLLREFLIQYYPIGIRLTGPSGPTVIAKPSV